METKLITPEIQEKVKEVYKEVESIRKTREIINRQLNLTLTFHNIRYCVSELLEDINNIKDNLKTINEEVKENNKYEVNETHYIFYLRHTEINGDIDYKPYSISIDLVDRIFKDYSKYGNNLSGEEILQKYAIKIELFNAIKNRLRLYKSSHTLSPISLERASEEDLQEHIDEAIDEHIQDKYKKKFVNTYEKRKQADYEKKSKILSNLDYVLTHLQGYLQNYKPRELNLNIPKIQNNDEITVMFSDLHIGKMNTEGVISRLNSMTISLVNRPEKIVNMVCLGDLFETIAKGGMHKGQIEKMDGVFGFDLLMQVVYTFENMLTALYNSGKQVTLLGIGGNHDRLTQNKDDGFAGMGAYITYELIKRGLKHLDITIEYLKNSWNVVDMQGFRYILHHGDNGATSKRASDILVEHGDLGKFNIISMGDKHHLEMKSTSDKAIQMIVPALAGRNEYDTMLGLSSNPGYVIIEKGENNLPITSTVFFKNN